jgi:hypothetical protein
MSTPFPKGGRIFALPGQINQTLPNPAKDYASVYLEAAQLPKSSGWFKSDTSLGLSFNLEITYTPQGGGGSSKYNVTKAYSFNVSRDDDGNVSLPLQSLPIIDPSPLLTVNDSKKSSLTNLSLTVTFLATRDDTGFSIALQEVFKISRKFPIPNPYTPFIELLGGGISDVVQKVQEQDANQLPCAAIGFQFSKPNPKASGFYVMLMSTDQHVGNGFIDTDRIDTTQLAFDPVQGLMYGGQTCKNAYVIFRLAYTEDELVETNPPNMPTPLAMNSLKDAKLLDEGRSMGIRANMSLASQFQHS